MAGLAQSWARWGLGWPRGIRDLKTGLSLPSRGQSTWLFCPLWRIQDSPKKLCSQMHVGKTPFPASQRGTVKSDFSRNPLRLTGLGCDSQGTPASPGWPAGINNDHLRLVRECWSHPSCADRLGGASLGHTWPVARAPTPVTRRTAETGGWTPGLPFITGLGLGCGRCLAHTYASFIMPALLHKQSKGG